MSAPHEAGGPRKSLIRAQFAPDARRCDPDHPAELSLVLDNVDTTERRVRIEIAGPLARYTRPRNQRLLQLVRQRQWSTAVCVQPEATEPEGGHGYDLHAVVVEERSGEVLFVTSARIRVDPWPDIKAKPEAPTPEIAGHQEIVKLVIRVQNAGNIPLRLDAQKVNEKYWVRDDDRQRDERLRAAERAITTESANPRTPVLLRPGGRHNFELRITSPSYWVGTRLRKWWVPIGIRGENVDAECVFAELVQRPQWRLEERMVWLGVAVVAALLVLIVFMIVLAT